MRNLTHWEQTALNTFGTYGLTADMLINLNLPGQKHIHEELEPFNAGHFKTLEYLIDGGFSAQAACDEIKELNPIQAGLISACCCPVDKRIQGDHLRNLQMSDSFDYAHEELAHRLHASELSSEEICKILQGLSAKEAGAMITSLFAQYYRDCHPTTLLWQCVAFFGSKKIDEQSRAQLIQNMPEHVAKRVTLAARL